MTAADTAVMLAAAGAVTVRDSAAGTRQVLVIHRPRHDDWSLPKGKLDENELSPVAAVREVAEETGHRVGLGAPLDSIQYRVFDTTHPAGTPKTVSWWRADVDTGGDPHGGDGPGLATLSPAGGAHPVDASGDGGIEPEVDRVAWVDAGEAARLLSYDSDRAVLDQALRQPVTTPVILVRHGKAVNRKDWEADDADRPLRPRGRTQARRLVPLLEAYGVDELFSSPWRRCTATLQPYATQRRLTECPVEVFNEDAGKQDPDGVHQAMIDICERAVVEHRPVAVCGHRPVIGDMLEALDVPSRRLATAECVVAHLTDAGALHAIEVHRPRA